MSDLIILLKRVIGQKLLGVTEHADGTVELHFDDFVVFCKVEYVSPIIERIPWRTTTG